MSNESTTSPAGAAGNKNSKRAAEGDAGLHPLLGRILAELAELRSLLDEQNAMLLALLPEQFVALSPEELIALNRNAPSTGLVVVSDFRSNVTRLAKGQRLDAGDERVRLYATAPGFQVALARDRAPSGVDLEELLKRRRRVEVEARLAAERAQREAEAARLAAVAAQAKASAEAIPTTIGGAQA